MAEASPLLDSAPLSLFAAGEPALGADRWARHQLDEDCYLDVAEGFVAGADSLLAELVARLPLRQSRRLMFGQYVDEPRLSCGVPLCSAPSVVRQMAAALGRRYSVTFDSCFANFYRDGSDSVAWHADREGQQILRPFVAIVSLGGPRRFALRPRGGGPQVAWVLHSGDAAVMGGACQHHFEHAVPKTKWAPPRLSLSFRHHLTADESLRR